MSAWTDEAWAEAYADRSAMLFFEETLVASAAIAHTCVLCGGAIETGRPYRRQVGMCKGDEGPWVSKEHLDCYAEAA